MEYATESQFMPYPLAIEQQARDMVAIFCTNMNFSNIKKGSSNITLCKRGWQSKS